MPETIPQIEPRPVHVTMYVHSPIARPHSLSAVSVEALRYAADDHRAWVTSRQRLAELR